MLSAIATGLTALSMLGSSTVGLTTPIVISDGPTGPDHITVDVVTVNGSGCPKDSAAVAVSPDNTAFTITYSQYTAEVGDGTGPNGTGQLNDRKNCQINVNVHVPQGFTYAIARADY